MSYAHGRYTKFPVAPSNFLPGTNTLGPATTVDATGNTTVHTPDFSATLTANYSVATRIGNLDLSVTNAYISSYFWEPDNIIKQPSVDLLNAALKWTSLNQRWDLRFYGQNLTNRLYFLAGQTTPLVAESTPAAPRTYGFVAGMHF
jgi:iron complex outermembrane receptor protein